MIDKAMNGWVHAKDVSKKCADCSWLVFEGKFAACEYGNRMFPNGDKCSQHSEARTEVL